MPVRSESTVIDIYDHIARGYDRLVGVSPGYHRQLLLSARRMGLPDTGLGLRLLDLGCGTGASTAALLDAVPEAKIVAVDASEGMLAEARTKTWPPSVRFVRAQVEELGREVVRGPFDGAFAAHVVRDLSDLDLVLAGVLRLLRPGAPFAVHDYSVAGALRPRVRWTAACWAAAAPAAWAITGSLELYRHYGRSVRRFDSTTKFERRLATAGFADVRTQTMVGWQEGMLFTWLGRKSGADHGPAGA